MSGSFTNASNFVISNSSFTHVSGNQHNYNFSGRPSASSYDAMARFVIAVDSSKSTTDNSSSSQKSEIYIHALRKSTDPTVACQTQSSTTSPHVQSARLSFEEPRADPHFAQPSFIRNPVAPPSPAQFPHAKTSPPSGASQSSRDGFVHQETSAGIDRLSNAETWFSSGDRISSPSSGPETEAIPSHSSTSDVGGSSSLAPLPAPTVVGPRAPYQPVTTRQYNCPDTAGAVRLPQARFPALPKHHVPPQNSYEIQTPSASPNFMRHPSYDVYRRQMNDDTPYPAWFEESRMVQSPLPSKNQHLESRHLSHPATPRRAYHSYPPVDSYTQNFDPHIQLHRESHMLGQESQTWGYYHDDRSDFQPKHRAALDPGFESHHQCSPLGPCTYNQYAPANNGVSAPATDGGRYITSAVPLFPRNTYYNAY